MEVPLQPAPFRIALLDDASAGGAEIVELGKHLYSQPLVVDGQPGGGADLLLERRPVEASDIVHDERDLPPRTDDRRDRTARIRIRRIARLARTVDEALRFGQPVEDVKVGVADCGGKRFAKLSRRRYLAQLSCECGDVAPSPLGSEHSPGDREREGGRGQRADEEDGGELAACVVLEAGMDQRRRVGGRGRTDQ